MNISQRQKIVVLGFLSHFPVAGVAWQTIHYLVGLQRLGWDVYYVEAHGCTPSKLMQHDADDGAVRAAEYIDRVLRRFDLGGHWAYHSLYEGRYFGMTELGLRDLLQSAALIINLHGSHLPRPELTATNRLVYLETDPVDVQIDLHDGKQESVDYLKPHFAFFTYGENLGGFDCRLPVPTQFKLLPTRQPVVLDFWQGHGTGVGEVFTTVGNWRQPWREVTFRGQAYTWSKHFEFQKIVDLPKRLNQPFELALASYDTRDEAELKRHGWGVRPALGFSTDLDAYRRYIGSSRGEFTVAKEQNVRLRSGWFSDRAVTYLAAGRPVITQETGFSQRLPVGEGLFAFSTLEEAIEAVDRVNADYQRNRAAAHRIAREFFSHDVVLARLLADVDLTRRTAASPPYRGLESRAVVVPTGRWPTRLPEDTLQAALELAPPSAVRLEQGTASRVSVVIVTYGGLAYTRMCLANLLRSGWRAEDELIIVDNCSTDGTPAFLTEVARLNPFVRVILNAQNRGFSAANNQGLRLAQGDIFVLLNNDTLPCHGWRDALVGWLSDTTIGLVGPVTNRTCNEAEIHAPYRTLGELEVFARDRSQRHQGRAGNIPMLAMFCVAMRREVWNTVGPLDEQFEVGMFEDDDYSRRVRQAGYQVVCAEDVFVHHFGQASLGELCENGEYNRLLAANRGRFEKKWSVTWRPHGRRVTPEYRALRERVHRSVSSFVPSGATVAIVSKGDDDLIRLDDRIGWHFPQASDGKYANQYPADSAEAIAQVEAVRKMGADYLLVPEPAMWWLDYYTDLKQHLSRYYRVVAEEDRTCLIYNLGGVDA